MCDYHKYYILYYDLFVHFFQLAKKYHPDTNKDKNAAQKFQEVNEAYEVS